MLTLLMEDWESARSQVKASMIRGITKEAPTVSWDDIGGLKDLKVRCVSYAHFRLSYNENLL